ncbi:hypothetical protein ACFLWA_09035 [Chloroflexota bacterium]
MQPTRTCTNNTCFGSGFLLKDRVSQRFPESFLKARPTLHGQHRDRANIGRILAVV